MATASGESVLPVQAAQAQSDVGEKASANSKMTISFAAGDRVWPWNQERRPPSPRPSPPGEGELFAAF
jgi:hypothetical protein